MIKICVFGLGYVGLPIALNISKKFNTIGFDINKDRVNSLIKKIDTNKEFNKKDFNKLKLNFSHVLDKISDCTYYIICVPTPVNSKKKPDLTALNQTFNSLKNIIKKNDTVILESTVYPGVTKIFGEKIQRFTNLKMNKDFFLCYSPERINPGDHTKKLNNINKIFSTETNNKKKINEIKSIYKLISKNIIFSNKIAESETAKVIENIQRDLNIAFYNEVLMVCDKLKLNFNEVIKLASSKWNFLKFNPGLVGGHCLPVDPYYLSYISSKNKLKLKTTLAGRETNNYMEKFVLNKFNDHLISNNLNKNIKILIVGITYKYGVSDMRNSINYKIFKKIKKNYPQTMIYDPFVKLEHNLTNLKKLNQIDVFLFLTMGPKFQKIFSKLRSDQKRIIDPFNYYINK